MRILCTGAAGFIGGWLCDALLKQGHFVIGVDDLSGSSNERVCLLSAEFEGVDRKDYTYRFHFGNCSNRVWMLDLFKHYKIDTLVHCAANARESASQFQPATVADRNLNAYSATLSAAISAGVKNVVCFSSLAVYGQGTQEPPFKESQLPQPEDVYGVNKYAMEMTTKILCELHGLNYAIIRPHNVFGEWQELRDPFRNVVGIFMNKIMRKEPLVLFNHGENVRAFSYIHDALPAMLEVIENTRLHNRLTVNIGGMEHITVNELARCVISNMKMWDALAVKLAPPRPLEVAVAYTDHTIQTDVLGYTETHGWRKGVENMAAWACERGPQEWRTFDVLEIDSYLMPQAWRDMLPNVLP